MIGSESDAERLLMSDISHTKCQKYFRCLRVRVTCNPRCIDPLEGRGDYGATSGNMKLVH